MVAANKGFMPVEAITNIPQVGTTMTRIPPFHSDVQIQRDYFAFWKKDSSNADIENFENILHNAFPII